jgi:hypothetical protein
MLARGIVCNSREARWKYVCGLREAHVKYMWSKREARGKLAGSSLEARWMLAGSAREGRGNFTGSLLEPLHITIRAARVMPEGCSREALCVTRAKADGSMCGLREARGKYAGSTREASGKPRGKPAGSPREAR